MERSQQHSVEFVALCTAAAIVYHQVTGTPLAPTGVAQSNAILEQVAAALAELAPIYILDPESGSQRQLDQMDLAFGVFQRGATALRTPKAEHRRLAIRRLDMRAAIEAFRRIGRNF